MTNSFKNQINKILILGHTCFIGKHLINDFKKRFPEIEIIGKSSQDIDLTVKNQVNTLTDIIDQNTIIIMLAFNAKQSGAVLDNFNQNISMVNNLCFTLNKNAPARFFFLSTQAVYGEDNHNPNITESTAVNPTSYYGMAKYISEKLFWKTFSSNNKTSFVTARIPRTFGPYDNYNNYGPTMFAYRAFKNEPIAIWGDGLEFRDYLFVDDLISIIQQITFSSYQGIINIASGESYSFIDVLRVVESICGKKIKIEHKPRTSSKVDHIFNISNLRKVIGDFKFTPLENSINMYYNFLQNTNIKSLQT